MFNFFKKQIHEPLANQRADIDQYPPEFARLVANGVDCDSVPGASGPLGSLSNPIPVNGALGEIKYLGKLLGRSGFAVFFHRIGSTSSHVCEHSIDIYQTVCMDASQWATFHFDMYHPRRSNLAPDGFTLMPFDRGLKMDLPIAYGVNELVSDFPYGLPDAIVKLYGEHPGATFARHAQEKLDHYNFRRSGGGSLSVAMLTDVIMPEWKTGQSILDDYLIEQELGRGGMGRVWLVKSNSTGRRFAVKQTLLKDEKYRKAFLTELQTWIDLPEHPNIVPCRFFRTVGDEIVIFADFIEDGSLADWITKRKLTTLEQILDVAIQFAWGLHAIHERGLIHQDVKPSNVLMTAGGVPMVTDFGLARARMRADDGSFESPALPSGQQSVLVSSGGMTPAYASPEQRAGKPLSRKTDIWSWGVSVLDMFMGGVSCPHGGHIATDVLENFIENGQEEAGLPKMSTEVAEVLEKCFASNPAERWENLDEAAQALIEIVENTTGQAYERKTHRISTPQSQVVQHDRRVENVQWRNPREWLREAYLAAGRNQTEADRYQPPAAFSRKGAGIAELAIYEEAERAFEQAIRNGHAEHRLLLARLYTNKALLCISVEDSTGAVKVFDRCIAILALLVEQEGRSELVDDLAGAYMNKARAVLLLGDLRGAVELYDRSIALYERLVKQEGRNELANGLAFTYMNKANAVKSLGDLRGAVELYDRCIALYERLVEQEGRSELANDLAMAYMNKANAKQSLGDLRGAVELYDHCIVIRERLVEQEGRSELANDLASAYLNKANAKQSLGDLHGAVELYDQCIVIRERLVEQEGRSELASGLVMVYMNKALAVKSLGDLRGAVELYDQCIAIDKRLVEQEGRNELANNLAAVYMNKAIAVQDLGDLHGAVELYDRCIAIRERLVEQDGRRELENELANAYMNKANAVADIGDLRGAVELYDQCIAIYERLVKQEGRNELSSDLAKTQLLRASILLELHAMNTVERSLAQSAFLQLKREAERTKRGDLRAVVAWAEKNLGAILNE